MFKIIKKFTYVIPVIGIAYNSSTSIKSAIFSLNAAENDLDLESVQFIFRHGARTPTVNLPYYIDLPNTAEVSWDPNDLLNILPPVDIDYVVQFENGEDAVVEDSPVEKFYIKKGPLPGGCLTGQLTTVGQKGMYEVGEWLKKQYIRKHGLLSENYDSNEVYIRSSFMRRTFLSATCLIAGLYGKDNIKAPVMITTKPLDIEDIYPNWGSCKNLKSWSSFCWRDVKLFPGHKNDFDEINEFLGTIDKPLHFVALWDFIHCRKVHNFFVPHYLLEKEDLIKKKASELQAFIVGGRNNEMLNVAIGSFVNTLCSVIEGQKETKTKLFLYSAHDTTIMALLMVFDLWDEKWPDLSSNIAIELYKNKDNKKYVRILYNGKPMILKEEHNMAEFYPVEKFLELVGRYREREYLRVCEQIQNVKYEF